MLDDSARGVAWPVGDGAPFVTSAPTADPVPDIDSVMTTSLDLADLPGPVLGIDTSGPAAVGLADPSGGQWRTRSQRERDHAERLTPLVGEVLDQAGLGPRDLAAIAVGTGPAPYTGLRIGLVTARTLGLALGVPVWGICSLSVLAADAARRLDLPARASILVATDAKRREVYYARYRVTEGGLAVLDDPQVGPATLAGKGDVVVGSGALLYPEVLTPTPGGPEAVDPVWLALLAAQRVRRGDPVPALPLYLRRPDISPPSHPKRVSP